MSDPTPKCGICHGSGVVPRDPDIGTDQQCYGCGATGEDLESTDSEYLTMMADNMDQQGWSYGAEQLRVIAKRIDWLASIAKRVY